MERCGLDGYACGSYLERIGLGTEILVEGKGKTGFVPGLPAGNGLKVAPEVLNGLDGLCRDVLTNGKGGPSHFEGTVADGNFGRLGNDFRSLRLCLGAGCGGDGRCSDH